jgi:hypothetical protein
MREESTGRTIETHRICSAYFSRPEMKIKIKIKIKLCSLGIIYNATLYVFKIKYFIILSY